MVRIGSAPPIARKKNASTPLPHTGELFLNPGPGGITCQSVESFDQKVAMLF
jgi:hypothetical protein